MKCSQVCGPCPSRSALPEERMSLSYLCSVPVPRGWQFPFQARERHLLSLSSVSSFAWGPTGVAGLSTPGAPLLAPEKDTLEKFWGTWAQGMITPVPAARTRVLPGLGRGTGVEERKRGGRALCFLLSPRGSRHSVFSLIRGASPSLATDPWRDQGDEAGVAQAQENDTKADNVGSVQQEEMETGAGAAERASGSGSLGVLGDPGLRQHSRRRGPGPKGGETQGGGGGRPERRGAA